MIGEIGFAEDEQAGDGALQVVIDPETAHGVVDGWINAHRHLIRIFVGDACVHLKEIAIALFDDVFAEAIDGIGEIEIDAEAGFTDAAALVANSFGVAGSDVARDKIAEAGIATFEIVVAFGFRNLIGRTLVASFAGHPDAAIVAQRFAHERELRLIIAGDRNASRGESA